MPDLRRPRRAAAALAATLTTAAAAPVLGAQTVFTAAGTDAAAIQTKVTEFRTALGTLNLNNPGSVGSGRREINWDGVPPTANSPNPFPGNFFNGNTTGRARGAVFSTGGSGFEVSADAGVAAPRFGNINPAYPTIFQTFSAPKLFTSIGSNVYDVQFFIPGSNVAATTRAFGAVFADVDLASTTSLEFFDAGGAPLGQYFAAAFGDGLSFLGVRFAGSSIARVRVTNGNAALGPNETPNVDLVVNDDFIYAEPLLAAQVVPEPGTWALVAAGLAGAAAVARRRVA